MDMLHSFILILLWDPHGSSVRVIKCAEHVQQLGSESLLPNLMGVKG